MSSGSQLIGVGNTVPSVNDFLAESTASRPSALPLSIHFNQNEEYFLKLSSDYTVPRFRIHHDVTKDRPDKEYLEGITDLLSDLTHLAPEIFRDVIYYFDPMDILKPKFYHRYRLDNQEYLYILNIDLIFRSQESELLQRGTNDLTPSYKTRNLFVEGLSIPLEDNGGGKGERGFVVVKQTLSDTWIGETGRGYFAKGIWMDDELTKFFTKLFIPKGKRLYPYYPFVCRYKTMCSTILHLSSEMRLESYRVHHNALTFLAPHMSRIQEELKEKNFSENLPIFQGLKKKVPTLWDTVYKSLRIVSYLNQNDMREFKVDCEPE